MCGRMPTHEIGLVVLMEIHSFMSWEDVCDLWQGFFMVLPNSLFLQTCALVF